MANAIQPASFTSPPETHHDAPEKGLPTRCPECKGWLRSAQWWDYEETGPREVTFYVKCNRCGIHVTDTGRTFP